MDSAPRRWVLKPLSPLLQPSDLRSIAGPAPDPQSDGSPSVLVLARQVSVSQDGSSSDECWPGSVSSSSESLCGFYSFVDDPTSPEAERNEAWMVSPRRQAQLATLKQEKGFKLQTYSGSRKPESLFLESNGDSAYQLDQNHNVSVSQEEEKQLREDIIRSQAPRKNPTGSGPGPAQNLDQNLGFNPFQSLDPVQNLDLRFSFSPMDSGPEPARPAGPGSVDKEEINFSEARQKFLKMEKDRLAALLSPVRSSRTQLEVLDLAEPDVYVTRKVVTYAAVETSDDPVLEAAGEKKVTVFQVEDDVFVEPDSGPEDGSVATRFDVPETPIEREIRLAQEREENLRRSRGLKLSTTTEMVEIKTKRLPLPATLGETNQIASSRDVQPEILGGLSLRMEAEDFRNTAESPESEDSPSPCCPHRHPEEPRFFQTASSFTESDAPRRFYQHGTSSSSSPVPPATERSWRDNLESTGLQSRGQGAPDFIEKEIQESLRREEELRKARAGQPIFSPAPLVEQAAKMAVRQFYPPINTDKPVSMSSSSPRPAVRPSSVSFITAQPWASSSSPSPGSPAGGRMPPLAHRGLTETLLQDYEEHRTKTKLDESSYAGIQLVDDVNNELVESTRVVRHKNQRALRWEAGVFANQENQ